MKNRTELFGLSLAQSDGQPIMSRSETFMHKIKRRWSDFRYRQFLKKHPGHGLFVSGSVGKEPSQIKSSLTRINPGD